MSTPADAASDVRFLYCAFALCDMLGAPAWRSINVDAAIAYLMRCRVSVCFAAWTREKVGRGGTHAERDKAKGKRRG
jgi:hypothetical protein